MSLYFSVSRIFHAFFVGFEVENIISLLDLTYLDNTTI